jgi:hypothetical protein
MDMEEPDTCPEFKRAGKGELRTVLHPLLEVHAVLTHDVIHDKRNWNVFHVVGECLTKTVVHIDLAVGWRYENIGYDVQELQTYRSPFWKSTTEVGTKNPWQQAVAPMPVTSRCARLELACSIAL